MGGASSKISRKFPSKPTQSWAGARTDTANQTLRNATASELKDSAIEKDARDPHFMQKLSQLGPVHVDHHMVTDTHMKNILRSRDVSEQQASSHTPTRNRMLAGMLFDLLEQRKSVRSKDELSKLADRYDIDLDVMERLAAFTNTPSIVEGSRRKLLEDDGQERFTMLAGWEDNALENTTKSASNTPQKLSTP
ncbi:hypothetical protein EW145_g5955 [Phellinidium pouzarii]|uniref:Uncharacterized protein n=1 Tax=Phellinidium pouzarii TaxID=167371 RepID=A0A4V6S142_9AGAM|nr:hypothetical protein EW145_g5955 [Phellinidium pouzarii]